MSNIINFPARPRAVDGVFGTFESALRDTLRIARAQFGGGSDLDRDRVKYARLVHDAMGRQIPVGGHLVLPRTLTANEIEAIKSEVKLFMPVVAEAIFQHCAERFAQAVIVLSCPGMLRAEIEALEGTGTDDV